MLLYPMNINYMVHFQYLLLAALASLVFLLLNFGIVLSSFVLST